jgi:hypothetical protein
MNKLAASVSLTLAVLSVLFMWSSSTGRSDAQLAVMPLEVALSSEGMRGLPAFLLGSDEILVEVPEAEIAVLRAAGVRVLGIRDPAPLWKSPYQVPDEVLDAAGVEVVYRTGRITVFSGAIDNAYRVLDSGYSISRVRFTPVSALVTPPPGREVLRRLLAERPLTPERVRFMRSIAEEASADSVEKAIYFLNFDASAGEYRSRFCARYELKQDVTPYLKQSLEKYFLPSAGTVWEQEFTPPLPSMYRGQDTTFVNVLADIPGTKTSARYIVCAHYDAIAVGEDGWDWQTDTAPGADDNASGTTTVLECARLLAGLEFDFGVTFALWSGEEIGLLGSDYYAVNLAAEDTIIGVINIDMIGYVDEFRMNEISYGWRSEWLSSALVETADSLGLETMFWSYSRPDLHNSDHGSFWVKGIPALMVGSQTAGDPPAPLTPYYHTTGDTLGTVDVHQVTDNVRLVAGYLSRFADIPGDSLSDIEVVPASIEFDWEGRSSFRPMVAGKDLTINVRALNRGGSMAGPTAYMLRVWWGEGGSGTPLHESPVSLNVVSGGIAEADATLETSTAVYGDINYFVSLLPVDEDVESDLQNNETVATVTIGPVTTVLDNFHVYPNPVSDPNEAHLTADISTSQTGFLASYIIEVFDVTGLLLLTGEGLIGSPELDIPLSDLMGDASHLVPGLYVCIIKMNVRDEIEDLSATAKFGVLSGPR